MSQTNIYYSHYDRIKNRGKDLEIHLNEVAEAAQSSVPPFMHFDLIDVQTIKDLLVLLGKYHDFGKYMSYFQQYLLEDIRSPYKNHAHISAWVFYRLIKENASCIPRDSQDFPLPFLLYVLIRNHHMKLTIDGLFPSENLTSMKGELQVQLKDLQKKRKILESAYGLNPELIEPVLNGNQILEEDDLLQGRAKIKKKRYRHERWYFFALYMFSQLVDKDKISAANISVRKRKSFRPEWVTTYLNKKKKKASSNVNDERENIRQIVNQQIQSLSDEEIKNKRIFTFTAPTGLGKTLTSLQAALELGLRIEQLFDYTPRFISAIPFINIIEQTKRDYAAVFEGHSTLNIHHRLSDKRLFLNQTNEQNLPLDQALLEVESWEGDVILTTFIQLFQSLFTGRNASLKKINKLAGSVVILDEIQSIPEKYMPLIGATIIKLSEYFGTRFILMTATQPYILKMGQALLERFDASLRVGQHESIVELLPGYQHYFKIMNRTKLIPAFEESMDSDQFIDFFMDTWEERSSVIVVNTIRRCIELFKLISLRLEDRAVVYHLSTNLIPKERKRVITEVETALKNHRKVVLVSTQTIEAGVDLDFAAGYRDLSPLESIIQTAGRVNRNYNLMKDGNPIIAPVYLVQIEKDHQWIYPMHHMERTKKLLAQYEEIMECEFLNLVDTYYEQMAQQISDDSIDLWREGVQKLDFDKITQFQLIPEKQGIVEIFVEWDKEAQELADAYEMIRSEKKELELDFLMSVTREKIDWDELHGVSPFQRKAVIQLLLSRMSEYMVQVRWPRFQKLKALPFSDRNGVESTFFWVPRDQLNDFYDPEVGYGEVDEARVW